MSRQLTQTKKFPRSKCWKHHVYKIKNQKKCNSCYIASTFGAIEVMHAQKYNEYINLAMQEIIDCCKENKHCKGGQPSSVADYVIKYGISTEENYPYLASKKYCRAKYYFNKVRSKSKKRILEQLLNDSPQKVENSPDRILQSRRYDQPKYIAKYDDGKGKFYFEVRYNNGHVRYIDLKNRRYTPSHIYSDTSSRSNSGRRTRRSSRSRHRSNISYREIILRLCGQFHQKKT